MEPTDALYKSHLPLLEQAANVAKRYRNGDGPERNRQVDFADLVQVGAEKWVRIVRTWSGKDGVELRALVYRAAFNAARDYMQRLRKHSSKRAPEEDAINIEDEAQSMGDGCVDMAVVMALPLDTRRVVMDVLDLTEGPDGTIISIDAPPRRRLVDHHRRGPIARRTRETIGTLLAMPEKT